jgi:Xaa-Pro aminopeptidase
LQNSNAGSLLLFDVNNIRYVSATKIGEWERDKMCRFCLLTGDDSPYVWDFGSAAVHHKKFRLARARPLPGRRRRHARHDPADFG